MCPLCLADGVLYEKLGFLCSFDLKRCALVSVYVFSFVLLKIVSGFFENFVIVMQWVF